MFGSSVLEVAIGVAFVYLLLSLVCTVINEGIASFINQRGKNLLEGIKNLLNDPKFTGLAQQVYNHGLIDGISQGATNPDKPNRLPSYVSSKNFALALVDILGSRGAAKSCQDAILQRQKELTQAQAKRDAEPGNAELNQAVSDAQAAWDEAKANGGNAEEVASKHHAAEVAAQKVASPNDLRAIEEASKALQEALAAGRTLAAQFPDALRNVQNAVEALPDGHTKESLFVLLDKTKREMALVSKEISAGEHQLERLRENLERWFDDAMDRFAGWYKRWTQLVTLIIATILVIVINADTILLANRLARDSALRGSIVAAAESTIQKISDDPTKSEAARRQLLADSASLNLPLGWISPKGIEGADPLAVGQPPQGFTGWLLKVTGLLLSILAVSLGAPFWFDTLSKFMNVRAAGPVPSKTQSSPTRDMKSGGA
jgi:hypothetical protein